MRAQIRETSYATAILTVILAGTAVGAAGPRQETTSDACGWSVLPVNGPHESGYRFALAYDSGAQRVVAFGGGYNTPSGETWEWDGDVWTRRLVPGPPPRVGHGMAYDSLRGRVVLYGGGSRLSPSGGVLSDTWEWDGARWSLVSTTGPGPRYLAGFAYDPIRQQTILQGGITNIAVTEDTWAWDGVAWSLRLSGGIGPRFGHSMAFDPVLGRVVSFGGRQAGPIFYGDMWGFNGLYWEAIPTVGGPSPRAGAAIASDLASNRVLLFGGYWADQNSPTSYSDTWEWDGSAWLGVAGASPAARAHASMAFDGARSKMTLFGGETDPSINASPEALWETWEHDGAGWQQRAESPSPTPRARGAMCRNAGGVGLVLFGGEIAGGQQSYGDDTWVWAEPFWRPAIGSTHPGARPSTAMVYDSHRDRVVLFGGLNQNDTWEWDGVSWTLIGVGGPPAMSGHCMAYDSERRRTVLFGGNSGAGTWTFDGVTWTLAATAGPSSRTGSAMAFDPARGRVLLFGGRAFPSSENLGDTWEWDGQAWAQAHVSGPPPRGEHALAYDTTRRRVVLVGGGDGSGPRTDVLWEWNGVGWSFIDDPGLQPRLGHAAAFDPVSGLVVLAGFASGNGGIGVTWDSHRWRGTLPGDVDLDRSVGFVDLNAVLSGFGATGRPGENLGDVDSSGVVDFIDLNLVLSFYGATCE